MTTADQTRAHPLHLRIFLASPGDVADERVVALNGLRGQVLNRAYCLKASIGLVILLV